MIITRSPLRVSLGGGGTDIPSFYKKHQGFVLSAAINKYVFTSVIEPYSNGYFLKYSQLENVKTINKIKHPIFREVLKKFRKFKRIEITTLADIPAGTGLGSSGSFTNSLIYSLNTLNRNILSKKNLAECACDIEINKLKRPVGKQDQYISAFGGIKEFKINKKGNVKVLDLKISLKTIQDLEENLLLFFTGFTRSSSTILDKQDKQTKNNSKKIIENLMHVKKMGLITKNLLENNDTHQFGELMKQHWKIKLQRSDNISNKKINYLYDQALSNGAIGGKLVGAGGGGFLMFYAKDKKKLFKKMQSFGIEELKFKFDFEGTKNI